MNMISASLFKEANLLLKHLQFDEILTHYGELTYTGSFALDLMVWPDIDLYLSLDDYEDKQKIISYICRDLIQNEDVVRVAFDKNLHLKYRSLPKGYAVGVRVDYNNRIWKLDIWAYDKAQRDENLKIMQEINKRLTPKLKELILKIKFSLLTEEGRMPKFSSYHIYQAILFEEILEEKEIIKYLQDRGVNL